MKTQFEGGGHLFDADHRYHGTSYTEDHKAWRQTMRRFADKEIMPFVEEWHEPAMRAHGMSLLVVESDS
ncbi:MAG: acyl-CoA dehydrogenase family protein [Pseudomonadales bacterium]